MRQRRPRAGVEIIQHRNWESAICGSSAVVNLAGEPISTRWTQDVKAEIMNSRIRVTDRLSVRDTNCPCSHVEMCILIYEPCSNPKIRTWVLQAAINACSEDERPAVLVSASALGYYGSSETSRFDETSGPGNDYLAKVCGEGTLP